MPAARRSERATSTVGDDLLLDRLVCVREHLVELLFPACLPDHDQGRLARFQHVTEIVGVAARHALEEVAAQAADEAAHRRRAPD